MRTSESGIKGRGKFIVLYGINNIGKSTQARMLAEALRQKGITAEYVKYPIYDLEPTGPRLNEILREDAEKGISEIDLQKIYTQNRHDYEPQLVEKLQSGVAIVAEDYTGTGIAWGWTKGAPLEELERMNGGLMREDIAILLDGKRFSHAKEEHHIHEREDTLVDACRQKHLELAGRYGWKTVNANLPLEEIHGKIWEAVNEMNF